MPKFENPVKGHLSCPVCASTATAHQCGEGQLIATGEPPKNSRNLGLMYYRCPECGNSAISKKIHQFIEANIAESKADVKPLKSPPLLVESAESVTIETELLTEPLTESTAFETEQKPVTQLDETKPVKRPTDKRRLLAIAGGLLFIVLALSMLFKKPKVTETEQADSEGVNHATG
ncbi:hypothetical protein [Enterovibrio calviensis]|uniref:hypothetical protein n=1 Tax=Enterovibrio calviensis TaxID=91359 RepID=UPI00047F0171|nr:hypothetical protein [Enterovibrio calviensis]